MKKLLFITILSIILIPVSCNKSHTNQESDLIITSDTHLNFDAKGGTSRITYIINKENSSSYANATSDQTWVTILQEQQDGIIDINVGSNLSSNQRYAEITLTYLENTQKVYITQAGNSSNEAVDIEYEAQMFWGTYYGDIFETNSANYWILLSKDGLDDMGNIYPNSELYRIDLYAPYAENLDNIKLPDGFYTLDNMNSMASYTMTVENSAFITTDSENSAEIIPFEDAEFIVKGNELTLVATIKGVRHRVVFNNDYTILDLSLKDYVSTLKGDHEADLSNHIAIVDSFGDYWDCGYCNYWIEIIPATQDKTGDSFILDFLIDSLEPSQDITGEYSSCGFMENDPTKPNFSPNTFVPGFRISGENHLMGSLFLEYNNSSLINNAPLSTGHFTITDNADGTHTIYIECYDDAPNPNKITATWRGTFQF